MTVCRPRGLWMLVPVLLALPIGVSYALVRSDPLTAEFWCRVVAVVLPGMVYFVYNLRRGYLIMPKEAPKSLWLWGVTAVVMWALMCFWIDRVMLRQ